MTRVAFIGAGQRSVRHMVALTHVPDVEIVGLADLEEERALAARQRANDQRNPEAPPIQASIFSDYRPMLEAVDPDCVYLCLPPYAHGEIDHYVIDRGLPVFFEKPMAVDMALAREFGDMPLQFKVGQPATFLNRVQLLSSISSPPARSSKPVSR